MLSETQVIRINRGAGDIPLHPYTNTAVITRGGVKWDAEEYTERDVPRAGFGHEVSFIGCSLFGYIA